LSGANVAFVLALVALLLRRLSLRTKLVGGLAVLVVFGTMTRWEPSVLRACVMAACSMIALHLRRPSLVITQNPQAPSTPGLRSASGRPRSAGSDMRLVRHHTHHRRADLLAMADDRRARQRESPDLSERRRSPALDGDLHRERDLRPGVVGHLGRAQREPGPRPCPRASLHSRTSVTSLERLENSDTDTGSCELGAADES
jgi:hypothetical protein